MHFLMAIILGLHFLLCQSVSSSSPSSLRDQTLSADEADGVLDKFFVDFNTNYLQKTKPLQITIVGASDDRLRQAQPLIESYPYIVCIDSEKCVYPDDFISKSFLIIFLNDLSEKTLEKNLRILSNCKSECPFLFVYEGVILENNDISLFIHRVLQHGVVYPRLAHLGENTIEVYHPVVTRNCSIMVELWFFWRVGTNLSKTISVSDGMLNFKGCPLSVGTVRSPPQMVTEKTPEGLITIVSGREGKLVLLLAEALNFSPVVKYPSALLNRTESRKEIMIDEVSSGIISFAIARLRPVNYRQQKIEFSNSYDAECVTWGTPRRMSSGINLVWTEFPWQLWVSIGSVFAISCVIKYAYHNMLREENGNRKLVGFVSTVLDVLAINLGYPVNYIPISKGGKFGLIIYLFYSTVVTTGYKASLGSILATVPSPRAISDGQGIIDANLKVGGSQYNLNILVDQGNTSQVVKKLIERYEVIHNNTEMINRLKFDHDFACLTRRSSLIYEKRMAIGAGDLITFDIFSRCFAVYPSVIFFKKGSPLVNPINSVLQRIVESGILEYWDDSTETNDKIAEMVNADRVLEELAKQKFGDVFLFYGVCLCVCLLVFFVEILTSKLKPQVISKIRGL